MPTKRRLDQYLAQWVEQDSARETVQQLITAITDAGIRLSQVVAAHDYAIQARDAGEEGGSAGLHKSLDMTAHDMFETALSEMPISFLASEQRGELQEPDPQARFGVAIDPLDGSSNIESNLSIGSIFSILEARADELYDIELGDRQWAAGFLFFGPQTRLILSCGEGTQVFLLDPESAQSLRVRHQHIQLSLLGLESQVLYRRLYRR